MPVVHSCTHTAQKSLVDGSKGPFRCRVALAHSSFSSGINVLAKAQVAALCGHTILLVQRHKQPQDVRDLEAFTPESAHVAVQSLDVMTRGKADSIELIAGFALRLVLALT